MVEPQRIVDPLREVNTHKRRLVWAREAIQNEDKYGALDGTSRYNNIPRAYSSYVALLCDIIYARPSSYDEATKIKLWKEAMTEVY